MMENCSNICNLTDDCLIDIFKYCDIQSLGRAASTCKRLNGIIKNYESVWFPKSRTVLGSNMVSPFMVKRSQPVLTPIERCKVARNWLSGTHQKESVMRYVQPRIWDMDSESIPGNLRCTERCMPWMCLERDYLFVSKGRRIVKLFRDEDGHVISNRISVPTRHKDDVSKFVVSEDDIFSGGWDGKICRYDKSSLTCIKSQTVHDGGVLGIDVKADILVTGSRDKTIKIWKIGQRNRPVIKVGDITTNVRVLSLALLPSTNFLVAGLPGTRDIHPLPVYDIEEKKLVLNLGGEGFVHGSGIIDIYPESENMFLTCGYDTKLKLWDVRTPNNCVSEWVEPYDNILYTAKSDHAFTLLAGANRSGFFHVWDKRTTAVIQTHHNQDFNSPVYCLQFDAAHVFTALNRAVIQHCFMP